MSDPGIVDESNSEHSNLPSSGDQMSRFDPSSAAEESLESRDSVAEREPSISGESSSVSIPLPEESSSSAPSSDASLPMEYNGAVIVAKLVSNNHDPNGQREMMQFDSDTAVFPSPEETVVEDYGAVVEAVAKESSTEESSMESASTGRDDENVPRAASGTEGEDTTGKKKDQVSPATAKRFAALERCISSNRPAMKHIHYPNERCNCLEIVDFGGTENPHRAQIRQIEKITEPRRYAIKINAAEFSRGDISVSLEGGKLSIYAKRNVDTEYGNEYHEFHKILKIPKDADVSSIAAKLYFDGNLVVHLLRRIA